MTNDVDDEQDEREQEPKRSLSFEKIKAQLADDELKYYKYEKRIKVLRNYIKKLSDQRIQFGKEIMECQEEQKKIIARSIQLERQKRKHKKLRK